MFGSVFSPMLIYEGRKGKFFPYEGNPTCLVLCL